MTMRPGSSASRLDDGTIEHAQQIANPPLKRAFGESPRTTKLDDRTSDAISLDEIERILVYYQHRSAGDRQRGPCSINIANPRAED